MPRTCLACSSPNRVEIDKAIAKGVRTTKKPAVGTTASPIVGIYPPAHGAHPSSGKSAKWMLAHLKPLDEWLATTPEEILHGCEDVLGTPVEFYHKFKAQLEKVIAEGGL